MVKWDISAFITNLLLQYKLQQLNTNLTWRWWPKNLVTTITTVIAIATNISYENYQGIEIFNQTGCTDLHNCFLWSRWNTCTHIRPLPQTQRMFRHSDMDFANTCCVFLQRCLRVTKQKIVLYKKKYQKIKTKQIAQNKNSTIFLELRRRYM